MMICTVEQSMVQGPSGVIRKALFLCCDQVVCFLCLFFAVYLNDIAAKRAFVMESLLADPDGREDGAFDNVPVLISVERTAAEGQRDLSGVRGV